MHSLAYFWTLYFSDKILDDILQAVLDQDGEQQPLLAADLCSQLGAETAVLLQLGQSAVNEPAGTLWCSMQDYAHYKGMYSQSKE